MARSTSPPPSCEQLLAQLVECLATPAFCVRRDGAITGWNGAASHLLGHCREAVLGRRCFRVLRGRDEAGAPICGPSCATMAARDRGETPAPFRIQVARSDGTWRWVECAAAPLAQRPRRAAPLLYQLSPSPQPGPERTPRPGPPTLTPRESQTLRLLGEGLDGNGLAERLGVRNVTARNHVQNLLRKLDVHSRLEAVARGRVWGMI